MNGLEFAHQPVLLQEVLAGLQVQVGGLYLDGTVGGGGHAAAILAAGAADTHLIGLDQDEAALQAAAQHLAPYAGRFTLLKSNFANMGEALEGLGYGPASLDGVLLDIGVSSYQLDTPERGFSYMQDAPLDMRMDQSQALTAAEIVNTWEEAELARIFYEYGEEKWAKRIAAFIIAERAETPICSTMQLVRVIKKAVPVGARDPEQHPAKRCFQSLRIIVNDELGVLERGLESAKTLLKPGGRLAVISFHSLEDRIVKEKYRYWASGCVCPKELPVCICGHQPEVCIINKKPITAGSAELQQNHRARSAKLRLAERLAENESGRSKQPKGGIQ